ncbi:L-piperidine-6-carboxylate dehydrogenase [Albibacterium profundi]|uniref:aldehyde dehydrogenase (NAD(+)) n=1 Tax=Albibacterium profundi TaxID=3134906 RepID=A0ABV5CG13_9SPHI
MTTKIHSVIERLGISPINPSWSTGKNDDINVSSKKITSVSPVDMQDIASVGVISDDDFEKVIRTAKAAYTIWRDIPAPQRGQVLRDFGDTLRKHKKDLGTLVSYEMGKSLQEGYGEVQEMIDICDFAVGLSRQLYGLTIHSERPNHRMYEQWHPLGIVGIISAFNFPVAVWSWNAALALVCGNVCLWKPSEKTPISAVVCQKLLSSVLQNHELPDGISNLIHGGAEIGSKMTNDSRIALISATGSTKMGKAVATAVAARLGKTILELGGNNAMIITADADLDTALPAAVFGAVGTAGQRCTSTRRLIIHEDVYEEFKKKLVGAYKQINIGNPLDENNHMGPLIDKDAIQSYLNTIEAIKTEGGSFLVEGKVFKPTELGSDTYVQPCIAEVDPSFDIIKTETFAPILYIMKYKTLDEAIQIQNNVPQGLSSSIMTLNLREAEVFLSHKGSDCGIANVNIGTSGAEIGGAFGGEKETGGGRESGTESWKAYMRRQTNTINYSKEIPLAQGIKFDLS